MSDDEVDTFVVDVAKNVHGGDLALSLQSRNRNANGSFSRPKVLSMSQGQIAQLPLSEDREILSSLPGGQSYSYGYAGTYLPIPESLLLSPALASILMPLVARTERCFLRPLNEPDNLLQLAWDEGGPWSFVLELHRLGETACTLAGFFQRGEERRELRRECDLSKLKGSVRGKYATRYQARTNLVLLSPDVAEYFPDEQSVNTALRKLIHVTKVKKIS